MVYSNNWVCEKKNYGLIKTISGWWCNNHLEKYEFVNGKDDIPYMKWKNKTCSKPPTRYGL
jgi:hypothetical protein